MHHNIDKQGPYGLYHTNVLLLLYQQLLAIDVNTLLLIVLPQLQRLSTTSA